MKAVIKNILKWILFHGIYAIYYRLQCCHGVEKDSVLFLDIRFLELCDSFWKLEEAYLRENKKTIHIFCLGESQISRKEYWKRCFTMLKHIARAELVYVDAGNSIISAIPLRKETKIVQLWHGCGAFKCFGYEAGLQEPYYNNISLVSVSGKEVVDIYSRSMHIPKEDIMPVGVSRTDVFFDEAFVSTARKRVAECYHGINGKKILLYAPTFRGNGADAKMPRLLDIEKLYQALSKEYVVLFKGHPAVKEEIMIADMYKDFFIDVSKSLTIEELICTADICISDYSSLIFEYSLFDKPMIFYAYDYEEYVTERGFYYSYQEFVPGPICSNTEEVIECILTCESQTPLRVQAFRKKFMDGCDGKATERIIQAAEELSQK